MRRFELKIYVFVSTKRLDAVCQKNIRYKFLMHWQAVRSHQHLSWKWDENAATKDSETHTMSTAPSHHFFFSLFTSWKHRPNTLRCAWNQFDHMERFHLRLRWNFDQSSFRRFNRIVQKRCKQSKQSICLCLRAAQQNASMNSMAARVPARPCGTRTNIKFLCMRHQCLRFRNNIVVGFLFGASAEVRASLPHSRYLHTKELNRAQSLIYARTVQSCFSWAISSTLSFIRTNVSFFFSLLSSYDKLYNFYAKAIV